jgi:hypothetical protein
MSLSKLWQHLFTTNDKETDIALHIAGATSRHRNLFESLPAYRNQEELSDEFVDKWVMEFYMVSIANLDDKTFTAFVQASKEITLDVVRELLGDCQLATSHRRCLLRGYQRLRRVDRYSRSASASKRSMLCWRRICTSIRNVPERTSKRLFEGLPRILLEATRPMV